MRPKAGEEVALGPYATECDFCHFEMTQMLDSRRNNRDPGGKRSP